MYDRTRRQLEGIDKVYNTSGILFYPPGFGKTNVGCFLAQKYYHNRTDVQIGVIVPSDVIKQQWDTTIATYRVPNIKVRTVRNILNEFKGRKFRINVLIIDEIHKFISDESFKIINGDIIHYDTIVGLTGSLSREVKTKLKPFLQVVDEISIKEAIANKWISNHLEFNLGVEYTKEEKELYIRLSKPITDTLDLFKSVPNLLGITELKDTYSVIRSCSNGFITKQYNQNSFMYETIRYNSITMCELVAKVMGWHVHLDTSTTRGKEIEYYWNPNNIKERCINFNNIVKRRNDLQNNNATKLNAVLSIINRFQNKKSIVFNESTEFAEKLNNAINLKYPKTSMCYHSNIESRFLYDDDNNIITHKNGKPKKFGKDSLKKIALEGLKSNKYKTLVTVKALDEGFDEDSINMSIITSGTINPLQYQQRKGRSYRVNPFDKDDVVLIFNIYMKSFYNIDNKEIVSRDAIKLNIRQKDNAISPIYINSIEDIIELYRF